MSSFLKDLIVGILFTAVVFTVHVLINDTLCTCEQFDWWWVLYGSQLFIYILLFLGMNYTAKKNKGNTGFVFLGAATFRLIFVAILLLIIKKDYTIDTESFVFHFISVVLIFIVFETIRTYIKFLKK